MSISIKSNADATLMSQRMGRANNLVKENIQRLSSGVRLQNGRHDPGALSVSIKLRASQKEINSHKSNIGNALSFLQTQESALSNAAKAVDRIATLKTLYSDPFKSDADRENYDKEFKELAEQLAFLKQSKFNNISLFSETESGFGLNLCSSKSVYGGVDSSNVISISQNVIDFEDIKRITEAGEATNRGFGGLEVVNFLESGSVAQVETLTIGGRVAEGDVFSVSIREQTSLLETESDTVISYTATAADESSADPNQSIRDELLNLLTSSATLSGFLTAAAATSDSLTLTSKMAGDPFKISAISSSGTTGSLNSTQTQSNIPKVAQVDSAVLNSSVNSVTFGDSISLEINGTPINYPASVTDSTNADLLAGLSNAINSSAEAANVTSSFTGGTFTISSNSPGVAFTITNQTTSIASDLAAAFTSSNVIANFNGQAQIESVVIGQDNIAPGGGNIATGDKYRVEINGTRFSVSANANETADSIRSRLISKISGVGVSATVGGAGELILTADDPGTAFSLSTPRNLQRDTFSSTTTTANASPFSVIKSLNFLTEMIAQNGAEQSRLLKANEHLSNNSQNYEKSQSRIKDLDFSREYSQVMKNQLRLDVLQSFIGKANIGASTILSLLY